MIPGIQLIGVAYALGMILLCTKKFKRQEFQGHELMAWIGFWSFFGLIAALPGILNSISAMLHTSRALDLVTIIGFLFLLAVVFHMFCEQKKTRARFNRLVQRLALQNEKETDEN